MNSRSCAERIYRGCPITKRYTEEDVDNARVYLQKLYQANHAFKPIKAPCKKLFVRKHFKCLPEEERLELIRILRILYKNGFIEHLANIHNDYWPEIHKTALFGQWHAHFRLVLEQEIRKYNPNIALAYWV